MKRVKSSSALGNVKSTSKKSKYFEPESSEELSNEDGESDSGSAYEEQGFDSPTPESELDADEDDPDSALESEEETQPSKSRAKPKGKAATKQSQGAESDHAALKGKELWREGVRTGLGPGKEVFFARPKAREAGDTPYQDETLHPNTKLFLEDLAQNNDRQWLKGMFSRTGPYSRGVFRPRWSAPRLRQLLTWLGHLAHDPDFRAAKKDFESFVETLTEKITEVDSTIPELPTKDLVWILQSPTETISCCLLPF